MFLGKKLRLWQFLSSISVHKRGQRALPIKSLIDGSHSSSSRLPGQRGDTGSNILASIELGSCNSVCLTQYNYFDIPVVHQFDDIKYIFRRYMYLVVWNFVPPTFRSMISFMEAVSTSLPPSAFAIINVFAPWSSEMNRWHHLEY